MRKTIDVYIVAGQSNGSGCTTIDAEKLKSLWPECYIGNKQVLYGGRAESTVNVNTPQVSTGVNEVLWENAKAGQGISSNHMGAEVGMAKVLNKGYYNALDNPDKTAGILKLAHGGTSLLNKTVGENAAGGNWVSPGYAKLRGWEYEGLTGGLYRSLLEQVALNVRRLNNKGYDVEIKGFFWMQGESDRDDVKNYKTAFKYFASDIRDDLSDLLEQDLHDLPFIIGEISRTSGSADSANMTTNQMFIDMQRELAQEMDNVYTVESSQFDINVWDESANKNKVDPVQKDYWHWNTESMFSIGELVGECILEKILK